MEKILEREGDQHVAILSMPIKKRFFTKDNKRVGKKSGKPRGKYKKHNERIVATLVEKEPQVIREKPAVEAEKNQELPKKPQIIAEEPIRDFRIFKQIGFIFFIAVIFALSVWQIIGLVQKSIILSHVVREREQVASKLQFWDNMTKQYPLYRDAYLQSAILSYQLGERTIVEGYLQKVFQMDPNNVFAEKLISGK